MTSLRILLFVACAALASAQTKGKVAPPPSSRSGPPTTTEPIPAAKPPKPGLVSCAGKIEGRYAESSVGQMQLEFRSGKTTLKLFGDTQVVDCWMQGKKVYLYMKGDPEPMEIDINDDGTLQAPMGEFKKKGA